MSVYKIFISLLILAIAILISCEKEKTEYKLYNDSGNYFFGFENFKSNIIIHDESMSYYSQESNKVFGNLFEYRNGRKLGKGIHSYKSIRLDHYDKIIGVITVEGENKVEIIDAKNFLSIKQISLESPRDIAHVNNRTTATILISCGNNSNNGKLVVIKANNYRNNNQFEIEEEIKTGNNPGKIFIHDYIYVFPNEKDNNSETISKIYYRDDGFGFYYLQKVEDIFVGENPVSFASFNEGLTGCYNESLAILCKGTSTNPASIVNFNLVLNKIINVYSFKTFDLQPEKIVRFKSHYTGNENDEIWFYANKKIYEAKLSQLDDPVVVFNKNISDFTRLNYPIYWDDNYLSVSRDTVGLNSKLYLSRFDPPSIFDSITINAYAKKISSYWY